MLFHDAVFVLIFLPLTICASLLLRRFCTQNAVVIFLAIASVFFYGYWNPNFVPLLTGSIVFNYCFGKYLLASKDQTKRKALLFLGITANLGLLIGFKYIGWIAEIVETLFGLSVKPTQLELPLGISFFTFLQIAYLVDASRRQVASTKFPNYFLFVTFFPHLIAGPLVHHQELIPQFERKLGCIWENLSVGLTIFGIGLFKKLILSDQVGVWSDSLFNSASAGIVPSMIDSWVGVISFALLIYFDFSAYSDMAIGLSKMFGIRLPENFNSPYKAVSIIDFWRRWHMTLSRFLRDYLYIPLGGNRSGFFRRYVNLMLVMLLAGLWHGASWKFVIWGGMHGGYLLINHAWNTMTNFKIFKPISVGITFIAVLFAWVPFRADTWQTAKTIYLNMLGFNGVVLPIHYQESLPETFTMWFVTHGVTFGATSVYGGAMQLMVLGSLLLFVFILPNTQQITSDFNPTLACVAPPTLRLFRWKPTRLGAIVMGVIGVYLLLLVVQGKSGEFIYFQF